MEVSSARAELRPNREVAINLPRLRQGRPRTEERLFRTFLSSGGTAGDAIVYKLVATQNGAGRR